MYDFLVVGGGPAGCAFAILAARAGARVALVERTDYSKRRPGEYIAGRVRGKLDKLKVSTSDARVTSIASPGIVSLWNSIVPIAKPHRADGQPPAFCVTRNRFDELLFNSAIDAGAGAFSSTSLRFLSREGNEEWNAVIEDATGGVHSVTARSVVDASGRSAMVARSQGIRRIHHGDLIAIAGWLENGKTSSRPTAMLTVESSSTGWWSLSAGPDGTQTATFYTSLHLLKASGATTEEWWAHALDESRAVKRALFGADTTLSDIGVYSAFPSRLSIVVGTGWIAIGDAAVAYDPIAGRGVATAMDTAFRAFEAAMVDPGWTRMGRDYQEVLIDGFERHLEGRARVYEEASPVFADRFLNGALGKMAVTLDKAITT